MTERGAEETRSRCAAAGVRPPVRLAAWLAILSCALGACQALPPAVGTALVGFGQDVLAAAAQNFAPQYASSMQNLLFALAETATGAPFTQPLGAGEEAYAAQAYYVEGTGPEPAGAPAGEPSGEPFGEPGYGSDFGSDVGLTLDVALLAQQRSPDGAVRLRPVQDGEVLYDGRGDPARGDKLKILFAANCSCYVYVIGIDATGYVAQIFPEAGAVPQNPVAPGARYLVPGGSTWWGLDDHRGVEQIHFVASRQRRHDIEDLLARLAGVRPSLPADYRPVREPAIVPTTRGLVQVQSAAPTVVSTEDGSLETVHPTSFQSTLADADLVVTRWFRHE